MISCVTTLSFGMFVCVQIHYTTSVQDVCFLEDGVTLVVALRDTNYLRVLSLGDLDVSKHDSAVAVFQCEWTFL